MSEEKRQWTEEEIKAFDTISQRQADATNAALRSICFDVGHLCGLVKHPDVAQMMRMKVFNLCRLTAAWANSADIGNQEVTDACNEFLEWEGLFNGTIVESESYEEASEEDYPGEEGEVENGETEGNPEESRSDL